MVFLRIHQGARPLELRAEPGRGPDCCDPGGGRDSRGGKIWTMVTRVGWKDYGWNIWNMMDLWNGWKGDFIWILLGLHEITIRGSLDSTMISP